MNRALRAATMGALLLSPIALTACSAGQVAQTATQNRDKVGPEAAVGDITLRAITLVHPEDGLYEEGDSAELQMAIVNGDTRPDTLVGIEGEDFAGVVVAGGATASPAVPGSPSAEPSPAPAEGTTAPETPAPQTPTVPEATTPETAAPEPTAGEATGPEATDPAATATPTAPQTPTAPEASTEVDIPIPARSTVFLGGADGVTVELADLSRTLTTGQSIEVTLTFERAGEVTVPALVATPDEVLPREEPFDFHHQEGGGAAEGAEDIAREEESESGSGPGEHN